MCLDGRRWRSIWRKERKMGYDRDRDDKSFAVYKMLYKGMPWDLFDFDNLESDSNGYYVKLKSVNELKSDERLNLGKYEAMIEKYGGILRLSGDADFGMKQNCTFDKETYNKAKEFFENMPTELMHMDNNYSLLVVNGGMNCRKGFKNCYRDIFPRFIYAISKYYEITVEEEKRKYTEQNLGKISAGSRPKKGMTKEKYDAKKEELYNRFYKQEIPALMCFLDTFDNFEDYFIKTHFWGESSFEIRNLLNKIKEFGKLIDNLSFYEESNIIKYCELAKEYWMIRNKIMKEKGIGT